MRELVDAAEGKREFDLIHDLAEPLPAIVIAELLGVPPSDHRQFREWSSAMIAGFAAPNAEARNTATAATRSLFAYLGDTIAARRRDPRDDLISAMIEARRSATPSRTASCSRPPPAAASRPQTTPTDRQRHARTAAEPDEWRRLCAEPRCYRRRSRSCCASTDPVQATLRVALEDIAIANT